MTLADRLTHGLWTMLCFGLGNFAYQALFDGNYDKAAAITFMQAIAVLWALAILRVPK